MLFDEFVVKYGVAVEFAACSLAPCQYPSISTNPSNLTIFGVYVSIVSP
jgi:hypothetical protein